MASIQTRTRSDGTVAYRVMFRIDGHLVGETLDTPQAAEDFRKLVDRIGGEAARCLRDARDDYASATLLSDWMADHISRLTGITDGTRRDYTAMTERHIDPTLGQYPLEAIGRRHIEVWVNGLTGTLAGKTLRNIHSLLSAALERAVREELIPANPAKAVRLPAPDHNKVEMVVLTQNEATQLQASFPEKWQPLIATLLGTGMRWGEATALQVGACDLDADPAVVHIRASWKRTGKSQKELGPPKTRKGRRAIPLSRPLAQEIRPLVDGRPADAFVFTSSQGNPVDHAHFSERVWKPALAKSGLSKRPRIHDLRHTYGTWMTGRLPVDQVQRLMGHESIQTTVDVYGHARPGDAQAAARAVEELLGAMLPVTDVDDGWPDELPAGLAVASLVADVERGDDPRAVG